MGNSEVNFMKLRQYHREGLKYNYTVCMGGPWYGQVSPNWFVEWVEANIIFGAEMIIIHNMSMSNELDPYVNYYVKQGNLEIFPWNYDPVMKSAWTKMQPTLIVNCQYRMRRRSKYIVQCDQDELIVPRYPGDITWTDMIKHSGCGANVYSYGARQLYYGLTYHNITQSTIGLTPIENNTGLVILDANRRNTVVLEYPERGKYIANTFIANFLGIHRAFAPPRVSACTLPVEIGASHHYRLRELSLGANDIITDKSTFKFKDMLTHRVARIINLIEGPLHVKHSS
jgi:hypothetical protein